MGTNRLFTGSVATLKASIGAQAGARRGKCPPRPPQTPAAPPIALQGRVLDIIRQVHRQLGLGVRRLCAVLAANPSLAKASAFKGGLLVLYQSPKAAPAEVALAAWLWEAEPSGLAPLSTLKDVELPPTGP